MSKGISTIAVYIGLFLLDVGLTMFYLVEILPLFYPFMGRGDYWLLWPTIGVFGGMWGLLITYVVQKAINYEYTEWKQASLLGIIFFITVTGLAYVFDKILPLNFEPFRSLVLPAMVFTIVFVIIARFIYPQERPEGRLLTVKLNMTEYNSRIGSEDNFHPQLKLPPVTYKATTYVITASFEGEEPLNSTGWAYTLDIQRCVALNPVLRKICRA